MNTRFDYWHRALAAAVLALAPAVGASATQQGRPLATPQDVSTNPVASVDPRVPPAAGPPCVVDLLRNRPWPQRDVYMDIDPTITYQPPAACPPPWSKVILKLDMRTTRRSVVETLGMDLARVRLFRTTAPRYGGLSRWHIERDLTDYSALFRAPHTGLMWSTQNEEAFDFEGDNTSSYNASAQLLFYPSSTATPAPRVPDAVVPVNQDATVSLPHNIVRAYLDVENDYQGNPFWYTCVTSWHRDENGLSPLLDVYAPGGGVKTSIFPHEQGCFGGNFREIAIAVDGTPAGVAPVFPLIVADLNWDRRNSADQPIPTLDMLDAKPYRVDLTPFAAVLSAAGRHAVTADNHVHDESASGGTALLLYLDPGRTQVSGAVTRNTLASESGAVTRSNTLQQTDLTIRGDIHTRQQRDFLIAGFVDTSQGRIDSQVHQTSRFDSTQAMHLEGEQRPYPEGDKLYSQVVSLASTVQQTSRRTAGTRLIARDRTSISYPLQLTYRIATHVENTDGWYARYKRTNVTVLQSRVMDGDHYKPGFGHYLTHAGARFFSVLKGGDEQPDPRWESNVLRNYRDNFGSCYHGQLASRDGVIVDLSKGDTCPDGRNQLRWYAHPDGTPYTLGWWH